MIQQVLTALARATLQSKVKVANQRIAQLVKTFGPNSRIVKKEIGLLEKGAAQFYTGTSASGNVKIEMRKITQALKEPRKRDEVNEVLGNILGIKIDASGNLEEIAKQGVKTVKEMRKEIERKMISYGEDPTLYTQNEQTKFYEDVLEMNENFKTAYDTAVARVGDSEIKKDPITSMLYKENRTHKGLLTYQEARSIHNRLIELAASSKSSALEFEKENGGNI